MAIDLTWDDIPIGEITATRSYELTDEVVSDYIETMGLEGVAWFEGPLAPYDRRLVPPDLIAKLGMTELIQDHVWERLGPNIRAKQAFRFLAPVFVGSTVVGTGRFADKYEKRGWRFVTMEVSYADTDGAPVLLDRRTQLLLSESFRLGG
jgi:N-terminal half of MaoC dehydratase